MLSAYIIKNAATGKSKGFGFVEFVDQKTAQEIIEIQFHVIKNVKVSCSLYLKRGKKYNKEFKSIENQLNLQKQMLRRGKSCHSISEHDLGNDFSSAKNYSNYSNYGDGHSYYYSNYSGGGQYNRPHSSGYSCSNDSNFLQNSESVGYSNNSGNLLAPPNQAFLPPDMNSGYHFQQYPHPPPMPVPQRNFNAPKRMSLEPYSMMSGLKPDSQNLRKIKNRRSLMVNYSKGAIPPPQILFKNPQQIYQNSELNAGGRAPLPTITLNHCDDLPPLNAPFRAQQSPSPHREQYSHFPSSGQPGYLPPMASVQTGPMGQFVPPREYQQFYTPNKKRDSLTVEKSHLSQNVETMASYGEYVAMEEVPGVLGKQRVKSFDLGKGAKEGGKVGCVSSPEEKEEEEQGDGDSFDENKLLRECFEL